MKNKILNSIYIFIVLNIVILTYIFIFRNNIYSNITREDCLVENLSAIFFVLTSITLIYSGSNILKFKKKYVLGLIYIIIGVVFIFGAGEEISWGQRIFNFKTPEKLLIINNQNELNIHNIDKKLFDRLVGRVTILFIIIATYFYTRNKKQIWGIILPDGLLISAFAIVPFYHQYNSLSFGFYHLVYIPLIALLIYSVWFKNKKILFVSIFTIIISLVLFYLHRKYNYLFPANKNSANEVREYLLSLVCFYYSVFILFSLRKIRKLN